MIFYFRKKCLLKYFNKQPKPKEITHKSSLSKAIFLISLKWYHKSKMVDKWSTHEKYNTSEEHSLGYIHV